MSDGGSSGLHGLAAAALEHEQWLVAERGVAANTLAAYRRDIRAWLAFLGRLGKVDVESVQPADVTAFLGALRSGHFPADRPLAPTTVERRAVAVRSFHRFCVREGLTESDPTERTRAGRLPRPLPKALHVEEVVRLIEAPDEATTLGLRDRAMLELLYGSGMRISELTALDRDDIDFESATVRCRGKGGRERIVPLGSHARHAVDAYMVRSRPALIARSPKGGHALFVSARGQRLTRQGAWKIVKSYVERLKLGKRVSPHTLRHSCATHMLDGGADIRVVQEALGHARLTTTQIYTAVSQQRLVETYMGAHPRAHVRARRHT